MKRISTLRVVMTALFASLTCVATMVLRVPSPVGGYLNLGDGCALLGAYLLGPAGGALAAGMGSMLADLLAGYPMYAAGTLAIKGASALTAGALLKRLAGGQAPRVGALAAAGVCGEMVMAAGYFAYAALALGYGAAAAAEIPGNLGQGAAGVIVSTLLTPMLLRSREVREVLDRLK